MTTSDEVLDCDTFRVDSAEVESNDKGGDRGGKDASEIGNEHSAVTGEFEGRGGGLWKVFFTSRLMNLPTCGWE